MRQQEHDSREKKDMDVAGKSGPGRHTHDPDEGEDDAECEQHTG